MGQGGWARREMGGAPESSVGNKESPLKPNNWSNLAGDEEVGGGVGEHGPFSELTSSFSELPRIFSEVVLLG